LKLFGDQHPQVAELYNNLGMVYRNLGDFQKSIGYFEKAMAIDLTGRAKRSVKGFLDEARRFAI
jgi:tetratricopeptide (TPR) repeat protein